MAGNWVLVARCGDVGQNENWWQSDPSQGGSVQCSQSLYNETINGPLLLLTEAEERQILRNTIVVVSFTGQPGLACVTG